MTLVYNIAMSSTQERPTFPPLKNDLLLRTARGETVERPPCWVMRQAGRYLPEYHEEKGKKDFFECCRNPEIASNLTLQPIDRFEGLIQEVDGGRGGSGARCRHWGRQPAREHERAQRGAREYM